MQLKISLIYLNGKFIKMYPKDFIKKVLIDEMQDIVAKHPYSAFVLICSGIEFLGKCIDTQTQDWNKYKPNGEQFKCAIIKLFPSKYHQYCDLLYQQLRNGLVHSLIPKSKIGLFSKNDEIYYKIFNEKHPIFDEDKNRLKIGIEYFYNDFVEACKKVLVMEFSEDKMDKPLLSTPSEGFQKKLSK